MATPVTVSFTVSGGEIQVDSSVLTPFAGKLVRVFSYFPLPGQFGYDSTPVEVNVPSSLPGGLITVRDYGLDPGVYEVQIEDLS